MNKNEKRSDQNPLLKLRTFDHTVGFGPDQKAFFRSYPNFKDSTLRPKAFWFNIATGTVFSGQGILTVSLGF